MNEEVWGVLANSPTSSREAFTDPAAPGVINVASSRNFSLKSWMISRIKDTAFREVSPHLAEDLVFLADNGTRFQAGC